MIEQQGQVVSASHGVVAVRIGVRSGCTACDAGRGCGAGLFSRLLRRRPVVLELEDSRDWNVGQGAVIGIPEPLLMRLVFRLYLFPLLAGLAGAAIGHYISVQVGMGSVANDIAALSGALLAGGAMLAWNRKREIEFPGAAAVHVLRPAGRSMTEPCAGPLLNEP